MGFAKIGVTNSLLAAVLQFPDGTKFYPSFPPRFDDTIDFVIEHHELNGSREEPPIIKPKHKQIKTDFDWNQP